MNKFSILAQDTTSQHHLQSQSCFIANPYSVSADDFNRIASSQSTANCSYSESDSTSEASTANTIEKIDSTTDYLRLLLADPSSKFTTKVLDHLVVSTAQDQESTNSSEDPISPISTADSRNSSLKKSLPSAKKSTCGKAASRASVKSSLVHFSKERLLQSGVLRDATRPFSSCVPATLGKDSASTQQNVFNQRASIPWKTTFASTVPSIDTLITMQATTSVPPVLGKAGNDFVDSNGKDYHMSTFGMGPGNSHHNNHNHGQGNGQLSIQEKYAYESKIQFLEQRVKELERQLQYTQNLLLSRDRDVDQLRSVLDQKVPTDEPMASSMDTIDEDEPLSPQTFALPSGAAKAGVAGLEQVMSPAQTQASPHPHQQMPRTKKQGVSGDSISHESKLEHHPKDMQSKVLIRDALLNNDFLKHLDDCQIQEMVECMYEKRVKQGCFIIREGEVGDALYVTAEGSLQVLKENRVLGNMEVGRAFGELALLYNCLRTASVRALTDAKFWTLDRKVYRQIMFASTTHRLEENKRFLKSIPVFGGLPDQKLNKLAEVLEESVHEANQYIIREGEMAQAFFIIKSGNTLVTQRDVTGNEKEIRRMGPGEWFGEIALYKLEKRTANVIAVQPGVTLLTLDRNNFIYLIGDLNEIKSKEYGDQRKGSTDSQEVPIAGKDLSVQQMGQMSVSMDKTVPIGVLTAGMAISAQAPPFVENAAFLMGQKPEPLHIYKEELHPIAILGIGGFGKVELVQWKKDMTKSFALKCMKKQHIVETKQEKHILSERNLMFEISCTHICKLYATYRDNKYVYMLLEACLGGELWTILRNRGNFDDNITRFVVGCVLEAFTYLHTRGILYRDLKPENLLLDARGYIKLCDFGFAKKVGIGKKTWTFCGTPEYVAPEIILSKGHDHSADYWSLGILMFELLTGCPPFTGSDPMKTYNVILRGIDAIDFQPNLIGRTPNNLIKRLCAQNPVERLGYGRGGIIDIKQHRYFMGFDWIGLCRSTMKPPIVPIIKGPDDCSNFDKYSEHPDSPPDELSGWDLEF